MSVGAAGQVNQGLDLGLFYEGVSWLENTYVDGSYVQVDYTLPDEGTIALWYKTPGLMYNYQTVWDNSGAPGAFGGGKDNWECWLTTYGPNGVYARGSDGEDGRWNDGENSRVEYSLSDNYDPHLDTWFHFTISWNKDEALGTMEMKEYVNGVLVDTAPQQLWQPAGDRFYLGGGNDGNNFGIGVFDELGIWSKQLTDAEVMDVFTNGVILPNPLEYGDTNGDGAINADDLSNFAQGWYGNVSPVTWASGDFNADGVVNADDLSLFGQGWYGPNGTGGGGEGAAAVPEPSTIAMLILGALCLAGYRLRK